MEKKKTMQKEFEHAMASGGAKSHFNSSKGIAPWISLFSSSRRMKDNADLKQTDIQIKASISLVIL